MEMQSEALAKSQVASEQIIKQERLFLQNDDVQYRLLERSACFLLRIERGEECCLLDLGQGFSRAARIFELFVKGRVTPCTAEDIWRDMLVAEEIGVGT